MLQVAYKQKLVQLDDILDCIRDAGFEADSLATKPAEASGKACCVTQHLHLHCCMLRHKLCLLAC